MVRSPLLLLLLVAAAAFAIAPEHGRHHEEPPPLYPFRTLHHLAQMTERTHFIHAVGVGLQNINLTGRLATFVHSRVAVPIDFQLHQVFFETFLKLPQNVQRNLTEMALTGVDHLEKHAPKLVEKLRGYLLYSLKQAFGRWQQLLRGALEAREHIFPNITNEQKDRMDDLLRAFGLPKNKTYLKMSFEQIVGNLNGTSFRSILEKIAQSYHKAPTLAKLKDLICKIGMPDKHQKLVAEHFKDFTQENGPRQLGYFLLKSKETLWEFFAKDFAKYYSWRDAVHLMRSYLALVMRPWREIRGHDVEEAQRRAIDSLRFSTRNMINCVFELLRDHPNHIQDRLAGLYKKFQENGEKIAEIGIKVKQKLLEVYREIPKEARDRAAYLFKPGHLFPVFNEFGLHHLYTRRAIPLGDKKEAAFKSIMAAIDSLEQHIGKEAANNIGRLTKSLFEGAGAC